MFLRKIVVGYEIKKSTSKDKIDYKHVEINEFYNHDIEDCKCFIIGKDRSPWYARRYSREGQVRNAGSSGSNDIPVKTTLNIDEIDLFERLMFSIPEDAYHKKGFQVEFEHAIKCTYKVRFSNGRANILIKVIEVSEIEPEIHIAGNIGHPDW